MFFKKLAHLLKNLRGWVERFREGANKQVISSQADSLIKISRIWADFFPANTSNQPI
ncbi:ABC transporter [Escherichia coli]|nr:ABC transporter [Escherichia coli]